MDQVREESDITSATAALSSSWSCPFWPATITGRKSNSSQRLDAALTASWAFYKTHYILPDGRVKRPDTKNDTVSEGQAYALLRAVWSNDQATFDRCYGWTEANLSQKNLKDQKSPGLALGAG